MPTGEIPNPSLDARVRAKDVEKIKEQIEFQTTADKILGLLADEPIEVELTESVSMQFYPPTDEQYIDILSIQGEGSQIAAQIKTMGLSSDASDEEAEQLVPQAMGIINHARDMLMSVNEILATLSVDKSWTAAKFKQLPKKYKSAILTAIATNQTQEIKKTEKFRKKRVGNRAVPDASVLEPKA